VTIGQTGGQGPDGLYGFQGQEPRIQRLGFGKDLGPRPTQHQDQLFKRWQAVEKALEQSQDQGFKTGLARQLIQTRTAQDEAARLSIDITQHGSGRNDPF
jgi:hypothetical protein